MSLPPDVNFRELVDESLRTYERFKGEVVPHSVPILFFGNADRYKESKNLKVITLGLNPSDREFPTGETFIRFPLMDGWECADHFDYARYRESLYRYFHVCPCDWFEHYKGILRGLDARYDDRTSPNTAVHTDFCTPLATASVWSKLTDATRTIFKEEGFSMWMNLVQYLEPDLVLASIGFNEHLRRLGEPALWKTVFPPIAKPYELRMLRRGFNGHTSLIVYGKPMHGQPFGGLTSEEKEIVGKFIRQQYEQLIS